MSSFINLMGNDIWTDADITRRTEAMVRSEFSLEAETILNRKVTGIALGQYTPTEADLEEMARFKAVVDAAHDMGVAARDDMELLLKVFDLEKSQARLNMPSLSENVSLEEIEKDAEERAAAQELINTADEKTLALWNARKNTETEVNSTN